jgi:cytochrome c556
MNKLIKLVFLLLAVTTLQAETKTDQAVGSQLPDSIRSLLIEEMQAINEGMAKILTGLVGADYALVAQQAQAIHDSFIMAQKITDEQRQVLKQTLPVAFIEKDKAFHQLSAQLAEAARAGNTEQQLQLYQSMQAACVACHQQHATDRFPDFSKNNP